MSYKGYTIHHIIADIEKEYGTSVKETIKFFREYPLRYKDIAEIFECSLMTLRRIRNYLDIELPNTKVIFDREPYYLHATDFLKSFPILEDAIIECRQTLRLTVEETADKLGVSRSTVVRYTPEWLKYTFNLSEKGLEGKRRGAKKTHNWNKKHHPWWKY